MTRRSRSWWWGMLLLTMALATSAAAQQQQPAIQWQEGPTVGKLGDIAEVRVPAGYRFVGKAGAMKLLELTQNPTSGNELGALVPNDEESARAKNMWFVIFEFSDIGYVKDDEKDKLDADAIYKSLDEGTEESNKIRKQRGWPSFHLTGWYKPPFYDPKTNNLTWAIRGKGDAPQGGESVNYSVRILGRRGTMNVDVVLSPERVGAVVPKFETVMEGFAFQTGQSYAEFRSGDKIAAVGLTALIAGGVGAAALKSGLLGKFWKLIVAGIVALGVALKKMAQYFKRMIQGKATEEDTVQQG